MSLKRPFNSWLLIGLLTLSLPGYSAALSGRVVGVADGDTLTLLQAGKTQVRIRLAQIDAPEKSQAYGQKSKASLSELVFNKDVTVSVETKDRYGRTVGTVFLDKKDINLEQVQRGFAWVYRQYAHDPAYQAAEEKARTDGVGLWADPAPVPPWRYRHPDQTQAVKPPAEDAPSTSASCKEDTHCRAFSNCAEVMAWVRRCGIGQLDGDHDGRPCETICSGQTAH